jgi:hypothetical protein
VARPNNLLEFGEIDRLNGLGAVAAEAKARYSVVQFLARK